MTDWAAQEKATHDFADHLTRTIRTVSPTAPRFIVDALPQGEQWRAVVKPDSPNTKAPIQLTIGERPLLRLRVRYECTVSRKHSFMLVESSSIAVIPGGTRGEPLLRLEYIRHPDQGVPCSHMHVHAHRDAWTFLMSRDGAGSRRKSVRARGQVDAAPSLSEIHFPVGGPRFRPTLEDFLEMLIHDLGIDHTKDALDVLADARCEWRTGQVRSVVSSMKDTAADVLRAAGWEVTPPEGHHERSDHPNWLPRY
ncbi:hypothetical protein [Actinomyces bowdenii]|uniref:Uncharacterized protein n=1 Tax=Actinomyces bowdenii TaxID=131109 RepID=A0A853EHW1_9ACTO|nr:hypothetical protein [Actinomyces bowdenii]MBF0696112.1 hypothetical protein [Actinomyces bowdenii]NYS68285.1 hypothetical protein [Actinomyces bowdenii]